MEYTKKFTKSKRIRDAYARWKRSDAWSINDVYKRPSEAKRLAERYAREHFSRLNGVGFRIISHNSHYFTYGFVFDDGWGRQCFAWGTAFNNYYAHIDELED